MHETAVPPKAGRRSTCSSKPTRNCVHCQQEVVEQRRRAVWFVLAEAATPVLKQSDLVVVQSEETFVAQAEAATDVGPTLGQGSAVDALELSDGVATFGKDPFEDRVPDCRVLDEVGVRLHDVGVGGCDAGGRVAHDVVQRRASDMIPSPALDTRRVVVLVRWSRI